MYRGTKAKPIQETERMLLWPKPSGGQVVSECKHGEVSKVPDNTRKGSASKLKANVVGQSLPQHVRN